LVDTVFKGSALYNLDLFTGSTNPRTMCEDTSVLSVCSSWSLGLQALSDDESDGKQSIKYSTSLNILVLQPRKILNSLYNEGMDFPVLGPIKVWIALYFRNR